MRLVTSHRAFRHYQLAPARCSPDGRGTSGDNPGRQPFFFSQPDYFNSELLTNATRWLSGDHDGTLIEPCPP
jgi:hypothetical protein